MICTVQRLATASGLVLGRGNGASSLLAKVWSRNFFFQTCGWPYLGNHDCSGGALSLCITVHVGRTRYHRLDNTPRFENQKRNGIIGELKIFLP
jgi:hypothetical protein